MEINADAVVNGGENGSEKRGHKREREKDEEQYILRLPPVLSQQMRLGLASKAKRDAAGTENTFRVQFISEREAFFFMNDKKYAGTMYDLPAILETHKTADKRTYYKSADVHQVLIVRLPEITDDKPPEPPQPAPDSLIEPYLLNDGIAPASKGAAKRFHIPKTSFGAAEVANVESKIKWVVDNKVTFVKKKPEAEKADAEEDVEIEVEDESTATPAVSSTPAKVTAAAPKPPTASAPRPIASLPKPPSVVQAAKSKPSTTSIPPAAKPEPTPPAAAITGTVAAPSAAPATKSPSPAPGTPLDMGTGLPSASGTPLDLPEDDDLEDFANMLGDEILGDANESAERRLKITTLDEKIEEQKAKIKAVEDKAKKMPNLAISNRVLSKKPELVAELNRLEEERKKLDE